MNRKLLGFPLAAMLMAICQGAETIAYHFASEPDLPTRVSECPLLKAAPAATPFVEAGDELRDLTEVLRSAKVPLVNGWALWNQTQRLLVVRGGIMDQWRIDDLTGFREQILHVRLTIDWIRSEKSATSIQENDPVFASVGLLGKSGNTSTASSQVVDPSGDWSFSVDGESTVREKKGIDSRLVVAWKGPEGDSTQHGDFTTNIFIPDGNTLSLASWQFAGYGPAWRLTAKGEILLSDGTVWRKARLRQVGDRADVCSGSSDEPYPNEFRQLPSAGDRKVITMSLGHDVIMDFHRSSVGHIDSTTDPFAEQPNPSAESLPDLPALVIPARLADVLTGPLLDLRTPITAAGVPLGADDTVAYDSIAERPFIYCKEQLTLDMLEVIIMPICGCGNLANVECEVWLFDGSAPNSPWMNLSLLGKSGVRSWFKLHAAKDQPIAIFDVDFTVGDKIERIDLRYDFKVHLKQQSISLGWQNATALTLSNGIPVLTDATKLPDGRSLKLGLRAKAVR